MGVVVTLGPQQIAFATSVAEAWRRSAIDRGRQPKNGLVADEARAGWLNVLGARTEMAAWKYLRPIAWHYRAIDGSVAGLPDLGSWIDVKGVSGVRDPTLIVPPSPGGSVPPRDWAYLLVDGTDHPAYRLVGWLWGHEFLDADHWDTRLPRPAWRGVTGLHPPADLLALVRAGRM